MLTYKMPVLDKLFITYIRIYIHKRKRVYTYVFVSQDAYICASLTTLSDTF